MKATQILCELSKFAQPQTGETETLVDAIRILAFAGDSEDFDELPPILTNDKHAPTLQMTWGCGGSDQENVYKQGPAPDGMLGRLVGSAIMDILGSAMPVLIFADHDSKVCTCMFYNAKLSYLESELYKFRSAPCPLEVRWKGSELSGCHIALMEMVSEYCKSVGLQDLPSFLMDSKADAHHLKRSGPIPLLHLRTPSNQDELVSVQTLIQTYLSLHPQNKNDADVEKFELDCEYSFEALFSKSCPIMSGAVNSELSDTVLSLSSCRGLCLLLTRLLKCKHSDEITSKLNSIIDKADSNVSNSTSKNDEAGQSYATISDLCKLSSKLHSTLSIGCEGGVQAQVHAICKSLFEPTDAVLAATDLLQCRDASMLSKMSSSGRLMLREISKRMDEQTCIMCIDLNSNREIKSIRIMNSTCDHDLDVDCAGRLLSCPWVIPISVLPSDKSCTKFLKLDSHDLDRDSAKACKQLYELQHGLQIDVAGNCNNFGKRIKRCEDMISLLVNTDSSKDGNAGEESDLHKLRYAKQRLSESSANKKPKNDE